MCAITISRGRALLWGLDHTECGRKALHVYGKCIYRTPLSDKTLYTAQCLRGAFTHLRGCSDSGFFCRGFCLFCSGFRRISGRWFTPFSFVRNKWHVIYFYAEFSTSLTANSAAEKSAPYNIMGSFPRGFQCCIRVLSILNLHPGNRA